MSLITNEHVERLSQYQPFDASFNQLFAEYVDTRTSDQIQTKALEFVKEVTSRSECRVVVLTGDAGHGKTHLCGQLIEAVAPETKDVRVVLREGASGEVPVSPLANGNDLYVIKDLSELDQPVAAARMVEALTSDRRVTVVCANEGRLREVISLRREELRPVQESLDEVLSSGQTSRDGVVWVVNLNHQSVAAADDKSLVQQALKNWVQDQRKWSPCERCDVRARCPIYENRRLLAAAGPAGESRRLGLTTLLRVAEQTNHIVTIRELLVFVAHTITGGLRCKDVHELTRTKAKDDWQHAHLFHEAAFGRRLGPRELERLEVFRATRLLDPGTRAIRPVDDHLHAQATEQSGRFTPPSRAAAGAAKNRDQHRVASAAESDLYRFLRRRDYFLARGGQPGVTGFAERLGFRYYNEFETLLDLAVPEQETVSTRNMLLSGLEALQGARRSANYGSFAIIDPAFSSHRGTASVVAAQIPKGKVRLVAQTAWWSMASDREPDLARAVDWVDRRIYAIVPDAQGELHPIALDCRQFELVCRAAQGLVSRAFFQADIRRLGAQLAKVAARAPAADEITVLVQGRPAKLVIDIGSVIQAAEL